MNQAVEVMDENGIPDVTDGRVFMTDRDRRQIAHADGVEEIEHYQAVSRVRRRMKENLAEDIELLEQHHPGLLEEIREHVCDDSDGESE